MLGAQRLTRDKPAATVSQSGRGEARPCAQRRGVLARLMQRFGGSAVVGGVLG